MKYRHRSPTKLTQTRSTDVELFRFCLLNSSTRLTVVLAGLSCIHCMQIEISDCRMVFTFEPRTGTCYHRYTIVLQTVDITTYCYES